MNADLGKSRYPVAPHSQTKLELNGHRLQTVGYMRTESPVAAEADDRVAVSSRFSARTENASTPFCLANAQRDSSISNIICQSAKADRLKTVGLDRAVGN